MISVSHLVIILKRLKEIVLVSIVFESMTSGASAFVGPMQVQKMLKSLITIKEEA